MTVRPWRGVAYYPCGNGARLVMRRVAARTRAGLAALEERAARDGMAFDCWELLPHPVIDAAARGQVADSSAG